MEERREKDIVADDILRGLGMCLQQAKSVRVITKALLATLVFGNYEAGACHASDNCN